MLHHVYDNCAFEVYAKNERALEPREERLKIARQSLPGYSQSRLSALSNPSSWQPVVAGIQQVFSWDIS